MTNTDKIIGKYSVEKFTKSIFEIDFLGFRLGLYKLDEKWKKIK